MRRVPIRMKLAAALAVPMLGLFLVTVVEVLDTTRDVDRIRSQTALARGTLGPSGLITTLQNERTWTVVELIGQEGSIQPPVVGYEDNRRQTDEAIAAFRETLDNESSAIGAAYEDALANLDQLSEIRDRIDASDAPRDLDNIPLSDDAYGAYAEMIRPFLDANSRVALAVDDVQLRQVTSLVDVTTRQVETISDLARGSILDIVVSGGIEEPSQIASTARIRSTFDDANATLLEARPPYDDLMAAEFPHEMVDDFSAQLDAALAGEAVDLDALIGPLDVPADGGYMGLRDTLVEALHERADQLNSQAESSERVYLALAVATMAAAIALTALVSRSITRPLRALTRQAKEMAENRLPDAVTGILTTPLGEDIVVPQVEPVGVRTRDEVADVADALNTVQDTALDLAVEQAVLRRNIADSFVNLGRRNQNLLGRQLDFITELESNESNPDALANLFRLDHLATRMRRNAESLLVLAGVEPPRQWTAPVRLTDVIRAALGEVESYQRVVVRGVEPATILGSAAADLAHLLAELIENALVFSPPDQTVDIRGRGRDDGGYTLAVIDAGLGMPPDDIVAANRRLAGAESFTIAPSKYLGHYVAGNLASRHDIGVRLDNSPGNGITATISVPPTLLTTDEVTSAPVTPPHGQRAVRAPGLDVPAPALPMQPAEPAGRPPVARPPERPWTETRPVGGATPDQRAWPAPVPSSTSAPPPAPVPTAAWQDPDPYRHMGPTDPTPTPGERGASSRSSLWSQTMPLASPDRRTGPVPVTDPAPPPAGAAPPPAPAPTTASGLARRSPLARSAPAPAPAHDDAVVAALGRYARPSAPSSPQAPTPPVPAPTSARAPLASRSAPPDVPTPSFGAPAESPMAPQDALTRRVRGAQLPQTTVTTLRRGSDHPPASRARRTPTQPPSDAADVQSLIASFTAGVQRGLDEARGRAADQSPGGDRSSGPIGHSPARYG
jgi:signal transduction histidine kinase